MRDEIWAARGKNNLERMMELHGPRAIAAHDQFQKSFQEQVLCLGGDPTSQDVLVGVEIALTIIRRAGSIEEAWARTASFLMLLAEAQFDRVR